MFDYNEKFNWFDDEELAKDWYNRMCGNIAWKMFENQEKWVYMAGELGEGRKPMIKGSEEFAEAMEQAMQDVFGFMREGIYYNFLRIYAEDDIDFPRELADDYNNYWDFEEDDDEFVEGIDE